MRICLGEKGKTLHVRYRCRLCKGSFTPTSLEPIGQRLESDSVNWRERDHAVSIISKLCFNRSEASPKPVESKLVPFLFWCELT